MSKDAICKPDKEENDFGFRYILPPENPCPECGNEMVRPITDKTGTILYCWYCDKEYKDNCGESFGREQKE